MNFNQTCTFQKLSFLAVVWIFSGTIQAQSVSFEELSPYGHTEVHEVHRSPNGDIYVISNLFKVVKSTDNGQNWTFVENLPTPSSEFFRMDFLDTGEEVFIFSVDGERGYYMNKNGNYANVIPDSLEIGFRGNNINFFDNIISVYDDGKLYQSVDKGETYKVLEDERANHKVEQLLLSYDNIYVRKEGGSNNTLDVYDREFNFLFTSDVWMTNYGELKIDKFGNLIHEYLTANKILYSGNKGQSFIKKDIPDGFNGYSILVKDSFCYIIQSDNVRKIKLDANFENNPVEEVANFPYSNFRNPGRFGQGYTKYDNGQFTIHDFVKSERLTIPNIKASGSIVTDIFVDKENNIMAGSGNVLRRSQDDGLSWSNYHAFYEGYNLSHTDDGGVVYSHLWGIVDVDKFGQESIWERNGAGIFNYKPFKLNNGQYRVLINCSFRDYFVSTDYGPFVRYTSPSPFLMDIFEGFTPTYEAKLVGDNIIIYNRNISTDLSAFFAQPQSLIKMNIQDNFSIDMDNSVNQVQNISTIVFGVIVNDQGEIFAHPLDSTQGSEFFQSSRYAPNIDSEFVIAGGGPQGQIYFDELNKLVVLISDNDELYYKTNFEENFQKLNIEARNFDDLHAGTFDNEGRFLMSVDCGRILRLDFTQILLSTDNFSPQEISLYPNPVSDVLHIDFSDYIEGTYTVFDGMGTKVLSGNLDTDQKRVDVNHLDSGVYFIELATKDYKAAQKFLKR